MAPNRLHPKPSRPTGHGCKYISNPTKETLENYGSLGITLSQEI